MKEKSNLSPGFDVEAFTASVFQFLMNAVAETHYAGADDDTAMQYVTDNFNHVVKMVKEAHIRLSQFKHYDKRVEEGARKMIVLINDENSTIKEIRDTYFDIQATFQDVDFLNLSEKELGRYGFERWVEDRPLVLIPIWAYELIPDGTALTSINDSFAVKGEDSVDMVPRFGKLGWGFPIKEDETDDAE